MSSLMRQILESKRQMRAQFVALSLPEKLTLLERMRERRRLIATSSLRQSSPAKV